MQTGYAKDKIVACSTFEETWWGACAGWLDERVGGWDGKAAVAGLGVDEAGNGGTRIVLLRKMTSGNWDWIDWKLDCLVLDFDYIVGIGVRGDVMRRSA
jgi:hypothetical protein